MPYRQIHDQFWDDPRIRGLSPNAKLLALYLITTRHGHLSGLYRLERYILAPHIGLPEPDLDAAILELEAAGYAYYDGQVVYVRKMFEYQARGAKANKSAATQAETLYRISKDLAESFLFDHPRVQALTTQEFKHTLSDTLSPRYPLRSQDTGYRTQKAVPESEVLQRGGADGNGRPDPERPSAPDPGPDPEPIRLPGPTAARIVRIARDHNPEFHLSNAGSTVLAQLADTQGTEHLMRVWRHYCQTRTEPKSISPIWFCDRWQIHAEQFGGSRDAVEAEHHERRRADARPLGPTPDPEVAGIRKREILKSALRSEASIEILAKSPNATGSKTNDPPESVPESRPDHDRSTESPVSHKTKSLEDHP